MRSEKRGQQFVSLAFGDGTPRKALLTALIVGSILIAVNHGDQILAGRNPPVIKVLLTFCVPYCVTTWGAVTGKIAQAKRQQLGPEAHFERMDETQ